MINRLPPMPNEWIDRSQPIDFTFEGTRFTGFVGDTISSALYSSGQRILGRSFKYHRPRGILSFANHDINALMQSGQNTDDKGRGTPAPNILLNLRADVTPLTAGMSLTAVNTVGGVMSDRASVINFFSPFLPVGFYYKAFHSKRLFPFWERMIRHLSGLGKVDVSTPQIQTAKRYDFCDVLVIGAGTSGCSAALTAAEAGADVVIVDENARSGGSSCYQLGGETLPHHTSVLEITNHPQIRMYLGTQAAGYYADGWVPLVDSLRLTKMRAKAVIVATGAYEQPAVFRNNDLPGIMLASAAQRLIYRYAVKPMNRAVVLVANSDGYRAAMDLVTNGITVVAIADLRCDYHRNDLTQALQARGIEIFSGHCVYEAKPNPAGDGVCAAVLSPIDQNGKPYGLRQAIACDGIIMSVGWASAANLLYQAGTKMRFDHHLQQFVPFILPTGVFACGRVNGVFESKQKLLDGRRAGCEAAAYLGYGEKVEVAIAPQQESPSHPYPIVEHPAGKNFVDFDEDLQLKDFHNAAQEGFDNIELLKRYTTVGMGPSQGKHSNMNALRILARITGKSPGEVGTTTARPFFHPVPMSHLAGRGFTPERQTPLHSRHADLGAKFMSAGVWQRPEYYVRPGKSREECIRLEAEAVRTRVGIIDVGTLGKFELRGADASEFLERVYTGRYTNMKVGTTRYALMLDEAGVIVDDGVVARLGAEHFYFTTTTSGATNIYRELTRLNTIWQLDCGIVNLTGAFAAFNLAGPLARDVLASLTNIDLCGHNFPYLGVREAEVAGIPAVLMRVGFVGEWGYEIHVAAQSAPAVWDRLQAGYDICPFGVEAQRRLRLEKGHIIVGQDTDGLTTPLEAGLEWAVKMDKSFFIGQRSLQIVRSNKQKLVGFTLDVNVETPPQECHLVISGDEIAGRVTSIAYSSTLKRYIGLAYVKPELISKGHFSIRVSDALVNATVTSTVFYDPQNTRQKEEMGGRGAEGQRGRGAEGKSQSKIQNPKSKILPGDEVNVENLGIADLSFLTRFGVKGAGAAAWLEKQAIEVPSRPNTWCLLPEGGIIARLGMSEFVIEDSLYSTVAPWLATLCKQLPEAVYPVLRQDTAIALSGNVNELLLQTCSFNFRALCLAEHPVILTQMIGVAVTVIPGERNGQPFYRIWCDGTFGAYLWKTLQAIASELELSAINIQRVV